MTTDQNPVTSRMMTLADRDRLGLPPIEWMTPRRVGAGRKAACAIWLAQNPDNGLRCGTGVPGLAVGNRIAVGWDAATGHLVLQVHPEGTYRVGKNHYLGGPLLYRWCRDRGLVPAVRYPVTWVAEDQTLWVRVVHPDPATASPPDRGEKRR
jgi:hypothetical protein